MLPPTRITAPTSETVRPNPQEWPSGVRTISKEFVESLASVMLNGDEFIAVCPGSFAGAVVQGVMIGTAASSAATGGGSETNQPAARNATKRDREPVDHDRRQTEQGVDENDNRRRPRKWKIASAARWAGRTQYDGCR